jgi:hypothetical protein
LIVIKRISFSFEDIKDKNSGNKVEDLTFTMILITNRKKIIAFSMAKYFMTTERYIKILKNIFDSIAIKIKKPFIVLFADYDIGSIHTWRCFYRFFCFIKRIFGSRVYIANMRKYFELNEYILYHIFMSIKLKQASITEKNFYSFI